MAQVRVAILGQGRSGRDIHGNSLLKMTEKYKIAAAVDENGDRRRRAEREYGCASYRSHEDVFERDDIDLVINALPSHQHVPVSLAFLRRGFHVLCEKPLARRASDVDELMEAAEQSGRILAVYQQSRFSPAFMQLRRVVEAGILGRLVQAGIAYNGFSRRWDWQTLKAMNGGNLLNTGPHPVDQALQLFGTDGMPGVLCRMDSANSYGDAEDYVKIILYGEGRPTIDVEISSCSAYPLFTYHIQGTRGGLMGNASHLDWRYYLPEESEPHRVTPSPLQQADGTPAYCREQLAWREESWDIDAEQDRDLFHAMAVSYYGMLYETLTAGAPLRVTLPEVRQQVAVMEECFRQNERFAL